MVIEYPLKSGAYLGRYHLPPFVEVIILVKTVEKYSGIVMQATRLSDFQNLPDILNLLDMGVIELKEKLCSFH